MGIARVSSGLIDAADQRLIAGVSRRVAPVSMRLIAAAVTVGCLALLVVSAALAPDGTGHGTHTQLGMPACVWAETFDKPCMTCGMTTSFALAADGNLIDSAKTQPFGFVLAVLTAGAFWGAGHVAVTGSMLTEAAGRVLNARLLWLALGLLLAAWAYKFVTWEV